MQARDPGWMIVEGRAHWVRATGWTRCGREAKPPVHFAAVQARRCLTCERRLTGASSR